MSNSFSLLDVLEFRSSNRINWPATERHVARLLIERHPEARQSELAIMGSNAMRQIRGRIKSARTGQWYNAVLRSGRDVLTDQEFYWSSQETPRSKVMTHKIEVTSTMLEQIGACPREQELFAAVFGPSAEITKENVIKALTAGLNVSFFMRLINKKVLGLIYNSSDNRYDCFCPSCLQELLHDDLIQNAKTRRLTQTLRLMVSRWQANHVQPNPEATNGIR